MSYLDFLLIFLIPPILLGSRNYLRTQHEHKRMIGFGILLLTVLAVVYTTPWDNYLVKTKVWWYGADRVIGVIGYVPIEEYCFFVLQTIMSGFLFFYLQQKIPIRKQPSARHRLNTAVSVFYIALLGFGVYGLFNESLRYMGLILSWAMPVLLFQWLIGGRYLLANGKLFLVSLVTPTLYLSLADSYAIADGIWALSEQQTTGLTFGVLPIEEATFFLVTNAMLLQGLLLFVAMEDKFFKRT